jgi:Domain of unknown function (DUF6983)
MATFALLTIPVGNSLPFVQFRITLSGVIYTLTFKYNTRMSRWVMEIDDANDNQLLSGIVLLIERNLTGQYLYLAIPPGVFFCTDDTGQDTQPVQTSFGVDHTFWYVDPDA